MRIVDKSIEPFGFFKVSKCDNFFGNTLKKTLEKFGCTNSFKIPAPIGMCIYIIERNAKNSETIYRRYLENTTLFEFVCDSINNHRMETILDELRNEPNLACEIIMKFLRELKEPLIPDDIIEQINSAHVEISDKESIRNMENLERIIFYLMATANHDTFAYLIRHFSRMLEYNHQNKIEIDLFVNKFQPYLRIKKSLLKFLINNALDLFRDTSSDSDIDWFDVKLI